MIIPCKSCNAVFRLDANLVETAGTKVRCSKCKAVFKVYPTDNVDRRKHRRLKTRNLISYISYDKAGKLISQGLGKALDISRGGILIEAPEPIEIGLLSLTATDVENNLIEIDGNVVYCKESSSGRHLSGIAFVGEEEQVAAFVTELIKQYNFQKRNLTSEQAF